MTPRFVESVVEEAALDWLGRLGGTIAHGPEIAQGSLLAERSDPAYRDVILERRFRDALARINPKLPSDALDDAFKKLTRVDAPSVTERNRAAHRMLVDGTRRGARRCRNSGRRRDRKV